jgi:hypothetical protein
VLETGSVKDLVMVEPAKKGTVKRKVEVIASGLKRRVALLNEDEETEIMPGI